MPSDLVLTPPEPRAITPMDLLQTAIQQEGSIDVIERLAKLQTEMMDRTDRVSFRDAITRFKAEMPKIIRSREIKDRDGNVKYKAVALEDVADPVMKALLRHGITYRFLSDVLPNGQIKVTCFLALNGTAYEEQGSTLAAPPDTAGGKDPLKAVGSTTSYLEKYTLMASIGMHVYGADPEAVKQGDSEQSGEMDDNAVRDYLAAIEGAGTRDELQKAYFDARDAASSAKDVRATEAFANAKNKRLGQLNRMNGGQK